MYRQRLGSSYTDGRGVIQDVLTEHLDAVTLIQTVAGAVRGNHYHRHTTQWTLVVAGTLVMANGKTHEVIESGALVMHPPGEPHAWRAIEDSVCMVFTRGPRAGDNYEADTYRLSEPLLTAEVA